MPSRFKKMANNFLGLSMVEVLLAGAMLAGLGLVVAKLGMESQRVSKSTESNLEMMNVFQDITYILSDKASCEETIKGTIGDPIEAIKRVKDGNVTEVYNRGVLYGNKSYQISNMVAEKNDNGTVSFLVDVAREDKIYGGKNIRKKIPLNAILSEDGNSIISCFTDEDGLLRSAVEASCKGDLARYDSETNECYHESDTVAKAVCERMDKYYWDVNSKRCKPDEPILNVLLAYNKDTNTIAKGCNEEGWIPMGSVAVYNESPYPRNVLLHALARVGDDNNADLLNLALVTSPDKAPEKYEDGTVETTVGAGLNRVRFLDRDTGILQSDPSLAAPLNIPLMSGHRMEPHSQIFATVFVRALAPVGGTNCVAWLGTAFAATDMYWNKDHRRLEGNHN